MDALWALGGFVVGVVAACLLMRQTQKPLEARFNDVKEQLSSRDSDIKNLAAKLEAAQLETADMRAKNQGLVCQIEERDAAHEQRIEELKTARIELSNQFKALSGEALAKSTEQLVSQAEEVLKRYREAAEGDDEARKKEIESLLQPVKENLQKMDVQNREMELLREGAYKALLDQVGSLRDQQAGLTKETTRLVKALQDPGSAGSWGEMVLERVVEMAGLDGYWNYLTQDTHVTEDGKQRPDMVISLPGGRSLIIDSKAPMRSYVTALETEDENTKMSLLIDHAKKLLDHAKEMKRRDYSKHIQSAPDFIVLFVPSESAYRIAAEKRPGLFEEASELNVLITTPMALLPLLKAVAYGWQQEKLAQSARQLQRDAAQLYDRVCKIATDYVQLGKALSAAGKKYNEMGATLESRVLPAARKFKEHGVQASTDVAIVEHLEFTPRPLQSPELAQGEVVSLPGFE